MKLKSCKIKFRGQTTHQLFTLNKLLKNNKKQKNGEALIKRNNYKALRKIASQTSSINFFRFFLQECNQMTLSKEL
jgi:hypothetical protein